MSPKSDPRGPAEPCPKPSRTPDSPRPEPHRPGKTQDGRSRARPANCENPICAASVRLTMKINQAAASCTPSSPRTPLGTWTGWRAPIPSRRGSAGSPLAIRRQTACAPSRASQARTSRWNKREVAPRARSWYTSCMMGGTLRRRRCLPSARRASRLAWEKRFSLSGLLRFSAAFRQRCCEEGMP